MLFHKGRTIALATLLSLAAAAPAFADDDDTAMPGMGMMMGRMMGMDMEDMSKHIEGRLAFLKAELKITDAQEAAWTNLAEALRSTAETHGKMMQSHMQEMHDSSFFKKPLPERLTFMETMMSARLEQISSIKAAFEALYGALGDDQKKVADQIALPMMGMGMMMGGRGMGRGMMMDMP